MIDGMLDWKCCKGTWAWHIQQNVIIYTPTFSSRQL
jgi:hypothetical protein